MGRDLTRGMVVLVDDPAACAGALEASQEYSAKTVAVAARGVHLTGVGEVVTAGKGGATIDAAYKVAGERRVPWISMRRDVTDPHHALAQMLEATGHHASKDVPGFAALMIDGPREVNRILTVLDLGDGQPSGLMALAAVGAAVFTGAHMDVLVLGAAGQSLRAATKADDILNVTRDRDLYDVAVRHAALSEGSSAWITMENVADRTAAVLEQIAAAPYDLVITDIGAVALGGRMGRGRRIKKALGHGGPGAITLALLESTDVPVVVVVDGVRIGAVPPTVVAGGAGALLALGMVSAAAPAATASGASRAAVQTSVSQTFDAYQTALAEAQSLAASAEVEAAASAAQQTYSQAAATAIAAVGGDTTVVMPMESVPEPVGGPVAQAAEVLEDDSVPAPTEQADAPTEMSAADADPDAPEFIAPADIAPAEVEPDDAKKVKASSVKVDKDVDRGDVNKAEKKADEAKSDLTKATKEFNALQEAALDAEDDVEDAAAAAAEADAAMSAAQANYSQVYEATEPVIEAKTGLRAIVNSDANQAEADAAVSAQAEALAQFREARIQADAALGTYQEAAVDLAEAYTELEDAADEVADADKAHQKAKAKDTATRQAYQQAVADSRVTPVPGHRITTNYGVAGSMWSTGYHTGVDYAAPSGTRVVAAASGTVIDISHGGSYGNRVVIEHENGIRTTYNHLSSISVSQGQEVTAGDRIGSVGNTGNSSGPHLHFEVTQGGGDGWGRGSFVNPATWLSGAVGG